MIVRSQIQEHMEVLDASGRHLGRVEHLVGGDRISLTRTDPRAGGPRRMIPVDWVTCLRGGRLLLDRSAEEAQRLWQH